MLVFQYWIFNTPQVLIFSIVILNNSWLSFILLFEWKDGSALVTASSDTLQKGTDRLSPDTKYQRWYAGSLLFSQLGSLRTGLAAGCTPAYQQVG